jgi:hypothetical protein
VLSLNLIQKGNNIQIWIWSFVLKTIGQSQFGPFGQLAQPAHSAAAKPTRLGSGSVNRPSPAPLALLSLIVPSGDLDRRRRRLAAPANSGGLHRRHLGRNAHLHAPYQLLRVDLPTASSSRRSGWSLPSGSAASEHPCCCASPSWSLLS